MTLILGFMALLVANTVYMTDRVIVQNLRIKFLMDCWSAEDKTLIPTDYCLETDESKYNFVWGK